MSWAVVLLLSAGSYVLKALGLLALGDREVPAGLLRVIDLLPSALLTALIVVQTVGGGAGEVVVDARVAGLAAAGIAVWRRAPFLLVVLAGVITTALIRALS